MATRSASWSDNEVKALIAEWSKEKIQEELEGSTAENDENNDTGEDATIPTSDAASAPDTSASTKKENEAHEGILGIELSFVGRFLRIANFPTDFLCYSTFTMCNIPLMISSRITDQEKERRKRKTLFNDS